MSIYVTRTHGRARRMAAAALSSLVVGFVALSAIAPPSAYAASPVIVNTGTNWLESLAMANGDNQGTARSIGVTVLVKHDPSSTLTISGLAIDDDWDGTDSTSTLAARSATVTKPSGVFDYSRATLKFSPGGSVPGFSCGVFSATRRVDAPLRVRAVMSDGTRSGVVSSNIHVVRDSQCTGYEDFAYLFGQSQSATSVTPGTAVTFTFQGDDYDTESFDGYRWRTRRLNDGLVSGETEVTFGGCDNCVKTQSVTFASRGRYVVEARLRSGGSYQDSSTTGWFRMGAVDVNTAAATSPTLNLSGPAEVNVGTPITVTASASDSADVNGKVQMIEWDLDGNGSYEVRDIGDPSTGLTASQLAKTISTTGRPNGNLAIGALVTDNGAMNGADGIRRIKSDTLNVYLNGIPTATSSAVSTPEDTPAPVTLLASDPDGHPLTYTLASTPSRGVLSGAAPNLTYTPSANYFGPDAFSFFVTDGHGGTSNTATVSINVTSVNDAPVATYTEVATNEDVALTFTPTATDVDGDTITFSPASQPANGSVAVATGGSALTYTPAADFNGTNTFDFTAADGNGGTGTASVLVVVNPVNDSPVADDQAVSTDEDTPLAITLTASDVDGDTLAFAVAAPPAHGTISGGGANLVYTPAANFNGADSFTFTADDGNGPDTATVSITVNSVNDIPIVAPADVATNEDNSVDITLRGSDVDGDALSFSVTSAPIHGSVVINGATATYTPAANYNGPDSFDFVANDGNGGTSTPATVAITVVSVNDAPVATATEATTDEDNAVGITLSGTDVDGDALTFAVSSAPSHGTVVINGATATYTPAANYNGPDSFDFVADDGNGGTSTPATVNITVASVNDAPVATSKVASTNEDTAVNITLTGSDVDGDALSFSVSSGPLNGSAVIEGATATYLPAANFHGADSFEITADDGNGGTGTATISITVRSVNDAPVSEAQPVALAEDSFSDITLVATDVDGDALAFSIVDAPVHGTLSGAAPSVTYTPTANFYGGDSFTFQADDGNGGASIALVSIAVGSVNDAPVAHRQSVATDEDIPLAITLTGSDVEDDALSFAVVSGPSHGTLVGVAPELVYTPAPNFDGTDAFTFSTDDGNGGTDTATVDIIIAGENDLPTADGQSVTTDEDGPVAVTLTGSDPELDELTFSVVDGPVHGTLSGVGADLTYAPATDFNGDDSFTFQVDDGNGGVDTAVVAITVAAVNDAPVAHAQSATTDEDTAIDITLTGADLDGDSLAFSVVDQPAHGTLSGSGASLTYTPDLDYNGSDAFTFQVDDGNGGTDLAVVSIDVAAVPLIATDLAASPAVARAVPGADVFLSFTARLTRATTGTALAGRTVAFKVSGETVCTATTNADGTASCGGLVDAANAAAAKGYTARFAGDADFAASTASGLILDVAGIGIF